MMIGREIQEQHVRSVAKEEIMEQTKNEKIEQLKSADRTLELTIFSLEKSREGIQEEIAKLENR